jgi:general secretion pathway protein D
MKRAFHPALMFSLVFLLIAPAIAESAKSLYNKGKIAEQRQNYEQAYDLYKQAYDQRPQELSYRSAFERLRFLAGASHVHRGQLLREAGRLEEALAEFQKAADIDPSSAIAKQEIQITNKMIQQAKAPAPQAAAPESPLEKRLQQASGPVELEPLPNIPMSMKQTEDSKVIYETIGKLAGINVLFDPDYTSRRIKVDLNSITYEEALQIIAMESKTFWRPVTPNTIFVAADNPAKRKEVEQSVIKTFYLSNISKPTELQDIVNAMRQILEIQRIQPLPSEGAIVVRGTPDQVALAQKLVTDLDKSKPEVVVDVAVLQINKDKKRTLGVSPPTSMSVQLQPNVNTTTNTNTNNPNNPLNNTFNNTNTGTSTNGTINLNSLANLNATDFQVTISQANVSALLSDSSTKLIQNPQIRSVEGEKATLKIGDRIPIATGSFQPGIGGVGINPLVNTQFQYQDVGVNIDVTPRVHTNGDVTLKISMDISSVTGTSNIGGIDQPIIGQRKIEHEVRLREGEANLMGGMLEDLQSKSLTGIPGLAQIPLLKYLFGQTATEHSQTETVFVLIPHIVRREVLTELNEEAIDVGTASGTPTLRHVTQTANTPATTTNPAGGAGSVAVPQPPAAAPPEPQLMPRGAAANFGFDPPTITQHAGSTFTVNVLLNGAQNVSSVPLELSYDPKLLQVVNVSNGGLLAQDGQIVTVTHREDDSTGTMHITAARPPGASGISGQGAVVTLTFMAKAPGQGSLTIARGGAQDPAHQALAVNGAAATVTIQ